jgi:hypothetical protein
MDARLVVLYSELLRITAFDIASRRGLLRKVSFAKDQAVFATSSERNRSILARAYSAIASMSFRFPIPNRA